MKRALVLAVLAACGDGGGEGTVSVQAYGESFIEDGIPAGDMSDGWAVRFERFEVEIHDVLLGGETVAGPLRVDLASGQGPQEIARRVVPSGDHTGSGFTLSRIEIVGTASRDAEEKSFSWTIDEPTTYADCETTTSVEDGGEATFQITVHADHLFFDSLVAEDPAMRFQSLAEADADGDGAITEAELAAADIGDYDPGSEGGIDDLRAWLLAQSRTLGHVDGEGHCQAQP